MKRICFRISSIKRGIPRDIRPRNFLMGSLAGAAHLLNNNTGVLRSTQYEQKSYVAHKGKCRFDLYFQYEYKLWKRGLAIL